PRAKLADHPYATTFAVYALPVVLTAVICVLTAYSSWLYRTGADDAVIHDLLRTINTSIYAYLAIAAAYFAATIVALLASFATTRNPIIHNQVKWILWAGLLATVPVGYTLYLAQFHPVEFALGE